MDNWEVLRVLNFQGVNWEVLNSIFEDFEFEFRRFSSLFVASFWESCFCFGFRGFGQVKRLMLNVAFNVGGFFFALDRFFLFVVLFIIVPLSSSSRRGVTRDTALP